MLPVFANTAMTMAYMTTKLAGFLESGRHRRRLLFWLFVGVWLTNSPRFSLSLMRRL